MAQRLKIWIYRPDFELSERKLNKNYVFNAKNERYFDVLDRENILKQKYFELLEREEEKKKRSLSSKMEVPYE